MNVPEGGGLGFDLWQEVGHFKGCHRRIPAFIAGFTAGTGDCLFGIFSGNHTEHDRYTGLQAGSGNAFGGLVADIIVVAGFTANDGAKADDRLIFPGLRQFQRRERPRFSSGLAQS